jgi:hypothetical protein
MRQNFGLAILANDHSFGLYLVMHSGAITPGVSVMLSGYWHNFLY